MHTWRQQRMCMHCGGGQTLQLSLAVSSGNPCTQHTHPGFVSQQRYRHNAEEAFTRARSSRERKLCLFFVHRSSSRVDHAVDRNAASSHGVDVCRLTILSHFHHKPLCCCNCHIAGRSPPRRRIALAQQQHDHNRKTTSARSNHLQVRLPVGVLWEASGGSPVRVVVAVSVKSRV